MVSEAMLPRAAVKEVEARLTAFLTVHWTPPKRQSSKN